MVSVRPKGDKIGMWLGDSSASESITTVGRRVKERLGIDPQVIFYNPYASGSLNITLVNTFDDLYERFISNLYLRFR